MEIDSYRLFRYVQLGYAQDSKQHGLDVRHIVELLELIDLVFRYVLVVIELGHGDDERFEDNWITVSSVLCVQYVS